MYREGDEKKMTIKAHMCNLIDQNQTFIFLFWFQVDNEIIIYCLYIYLHYINYSIKNNNMRLLSPHIYIYIFIEWENMFIVRQKILMFYIVGPKRWLHWKWPSSMHGNLPSLLLLLFIYLLLFSPHKLIDILSRQCWNGIDIMVSSSSALSISSCGTIYSPYTHMNCTTRGPMSRAGTDVNWCGTGVTLKYKNYIRETHRASFSLFFLKFL